MRQHSRSAIIPFPKSLERPHRCSQNSERDRFGSEVIQRGTRRCPSDAVSCSLRRRNGQIFQDRRGIDRGRRDQRGCRFNDGAAQTLRNVAGHGLPRALAPLVPRFPSMAVEQDAQGDREAADGEDPLHVVGRPGPPELLEGFDVVPGIGKWSQDRHQAQGDAEDNEDGPGSLEGSALRRLLGSGVPEPGPGRHATALEGPHAGRGTRMDPNKGHGENIRTYNWTENGRRSFGRPRITASRRPDPQNPGPNGFHFPLTADESAPVADLEGLRTRGFEIPADRNRHRPRNLSSTAKQNDKIPQGNIYRG